MANLRIVYNNRVTAIGGSSTAAAINDYKSQFQSGTSFTVTTGALTGAVAVVAVLAEDVGAVTMTVTGNGTASTTESTSSASTTTPNVGYGGVKYVAVYYTPSASTTSFTVAFNKTVKVSRFIIGNYWSPTHNTGYGVSTGYTESSTIERLQSGDQYVTRLPKNRVLQFDLQYMNESDKYTLFDILRSNGKITPVFVSVFPEDTFKDKEQMYSLYGRFSTLPNISHTTYTMYASSIQLEEF